MSNFIRVGASEIVSQVGGVTAIRFKESPEYKMNKAIFFIAVLAVFARARRAGCGPRIPASTARKRCLAAAFHRLALVVSAGWTAAPD
jgi:hypothetical protein